MTELKKPRGRPFQKGNTASKGAAKIVEGIPGHKITKTEVERIFHLYLKMTHTDFKLWIENAAITTFDVMICRAIEEAIIEGDVKRIEFFLCRLIGKVPDTIQVDARTRLSEQSLTINKLDGSQHILKVEPEEVE